MVNNNSSVNKIYNRGYNIVTTYVWCNKCTTTRKAIVERT